jgi:translation elongation factor EF-1alpha
MSRHRHVRNLDEDDYDCNDYFDDEDYDHEQRSDSSSTAAFIYNRGGSQVQSTDIPSGQVATPLPAYVGSGSAEAGRVSAIIARRGPPPGLGCGPAAERTSSTTERLFGGKASAPSSSFPGKPAVAPSGAPLPASVSRLEQEQPLLYQQQLDQLQRLQQWQLQLQLQAQRKQGQEPSQPSQQQQPQALSPSALTLASSANLDSELPASGPSSLLSLASPEPLPQLRPSVTALSDLSMDADNSSHSCQNTGLDGSLGSDAMPSFLSQAATSWLPNATAAVAAAEAGTSAHTPPFSLLALVKSTVAIPPSLLSLSATPCSTSPLQQHQQPPQQLRLQEQTQVGLGTPSLLSLAQASAANPSLFGITQGPRCRGGSGDGINFGSLDSKTTSPLESSQALPSLLSIAAASCREATVAPTTSTSAASAPPPTAVQTPAGSDPNPRSSNSGCGRDGSGLSTISVGPVESEVSPSVFGLVLCDHTNHPSPFSHHCPVPSTPMLRPMSMTGAAGTPRFDFTTPSPDDVIAAAQQRAKRRPEDRAAAAASAGGGPSSSSAASATASTAAAAFKAPGKKVKNTAAKSGKVGGAPGAASASKIMRQSIVHDLAGMGLDADEGVLAETTADAASLMRQRSTGPELPPQSSSSLDSAKAVQCVQLWLEELKAEYEGHQAKVKQTLSIVVIGHVDAGKSTLMGHLLLKSGEVNQRQLHKNETESKKAGKGSFLYAWMLDETDEERSRGVTIDVAQAHFQTKTKRIVLLDAPGHKDFIPNMITGASVADIAVLVVSVMHGQFESGFELGGQTREHALLARSLGISQLVVVINKMDTISWAHERYAEVQGLVQAYLRQIGFKDRAVAYIPCSGFQGENLTSPCTAAAAAWYKGPTLVDVIDSLSPPLRSVDAPMRFVVSDVFKEAGSGLSVSGKLLTGFVRVGDRVLLMPGSERAQIKAIEGSTPQKPWISAGDSASMTLVDVDPNHLLVGSVLCDPLAPVMVARRIKAQILVFDVDVPITNGYSVICHSL